MAVNYIDSGLGWVVDERFYKLDPGTLAVLSGRTYYTVSRGAIVFATVYNGINTGVVVLSTNRDYVAYQPGGIVSQGSFKYLGQTWYITNFGNWVSGNQTDTSGTSQKLTITDANYATVGAKILRAAGVTPSEYAQTSDTKIYYFGSSKVIRRLCQIINSVARLGTSHTTAFYGDLGQEAYDHSQTIGNPHGTTLEDLGIENIQRQLDLLMESVGSKDQWISHGDDYQFIDHEGDYLVFSASSNLLAWH